MAKGRAMAKFPPTNNIAIAAVGSIQHPSPNSFLYNFYLTKRPIGRVLFSDWRRIGVYIDYIQGGLIAGVGMAVFGAPYPKFAVFFGD